MALTIDNGQVTPGISGGMTTSGLVSGGITTNSSELGINVI
jgi:hypothetical protein